MYKKTADPLKENPPRRECRVTLSTDGARVLRDLRPGMGVR